MVLAYSSLAQNLLVSGKLFENKKLSEGVKIQLIQNSLLKDSTYSTATGYFEISVPFNGLYLLRLTKYGYVPKNLEIDTKIGSIYSRQTFYQEIFLNFEKAPFGLDLSDLDTAMARIYFSEKSTRFVYDESYFISKAVYDNLLMKKVKAQENTIARIQDELDSLSPAARKALGLDAKEYEMRRRVNAWESKAKSEYYTANKVAKDIIKIAQLRAKNIYSKSYDSIQIRTRYRDTSTIDGQQKYLSEQKYLLEIQRLNVITREDSLRLFEKEAELAKQQLVLIEAQSELEIKQSLLSLQQEKLKNRNRLIIFIVIFLFFLVLVLFIIINVNKQRKKLNKQLLAANKELERLNVAVSQTQNGIVICNTLGEIIWYNQGFVRMLGYSDNEFKKIISSNFLEFFENQYLSEAFSNNSLTEFTTSFQLLNGAEKWLRVVATPVNSYNDTDSSLNSFIVIISNVTELKNALHEIEVQANRLEIQNSKITDSIRYAKKIQNAILFPMDRIAPRFDIFSVFMPKDIVSGDFYYYKSISENKYVFAAADCTGHGVPGAFMSLLSYEKLDKIFAQQEKIDPAKALTQLDNEITELLATNKSDTEDGLEIALIYVEDLGDKFKVVFSGANRPMLLFNLADKKLEMIKGDKKGIGGKDYYYLDETFKNQFFYITFETRIYLYSDGLIDLRGNGNNRFGTNNFLQLVKKIGHLNAEMQKNEIENTIFALINETEQRDDITLISVKLNTEWSKNI